MKQINISEAEWKIMQILWAEEALTLKEIAGALKGAGWSYTTIRTMVGRLTDKGAVIADKSVANNFKYHAAIDESVCKRKMAVSFIDRVFDGSVSRLVANLAKGSSLSDEERNELMEIIEKMDGGKK